MKTFKVINPHYIEEVRAASIDEVINRYKKTLSQLIPARARVPYEVVVNRVSDHRAFVTLYKKGAQFSGVAIRA